MSGLLGSQQWMYSTGFYPYEIDQSLRFNDNDSAYLNRTPASSGNRRTFTWSGWVKRGNITNFSHMFQQRVDSDSSQQFGISFRDDDTLRVIDQNQALAPGNILLLDTSAKFRDCSAWYHIVVAVDTTLSTSSDRAKLYVNGERITSFSSPTYYGTQNYQTSVNNTVRALIGANRGNVGSTLKDYFDGYMAEVNLIDGQALDATSFGEFKSGVWIPKSYSGSYGTNGFYLDFGNSGSLGADSSGNGNNWTPTNLAAMDQVPDSPTNNFCTWNPLDRGDLLGLSEGSTEAAYTSGFWAAGKSTVGVTSGKWYWEVVKTTANQSMIGIGTTDMPVAGNTHPGYDAYSWAYYSDTGNKLNNNTSVSYGATYASGDVIGVAFDADAGSLTFYKNGVSQGVAYTGLTSGPYFPVIGVFQATVVANFGQDSSFAGNKTAQGNTDANGIGDFYYAPPAGYLALCTANLPDPVIDPAQDDVPADYFNTVLWSGDNTSPFSLTGVGFQPDFVWAKTRNVAAGHTLFDAVRGTGNYLISDNTNAETTTNSFGMPTSFDADGWSAEEGTYAGFEFGNFNMSGRTYVAWHWLAGNGTASNTDGTITSTVSANQKAGFSIVSYTGVGSTGDSVGHGLSQTPELLIIKNRDVAANWNVQTTVLSSYAFAYAYLNLTNSFNNSVNPPTSSVFYTYNNNESGSAHDYIAYCFHSVEGFSKIGSYTGNGSTDGPFVYTGFRPAFVLMKDTGSAEHWQMVDSARDTYNVVDSALFPSLSNAEGSNANIHRDFLSNGFKVRTSDPSQNASGRTYIYMAFAEMPFKYSNAR